MAASPAPGPWKRKTGRPTGGRRRWRWWYSRQKSSNQDPDLLDFARRSQGWPPKFEFEGYSLAGEPERESANVRAKPQTLCKGPGLRKPRCPAPLVGARGPVGSSWGGTRERRTLSPTNAKRTRRRRRRVAPPPSSRLDQGNKREAKRADQANLGGEWRCPTRKPIDLLVGS